MSGLSTGSGIGWMPHALARLSRYALRYRFQCVLALSSALAATALNLLMPHLLGRAIDQAHQLLTAGGSASQTLWISAGALIAAASLRGLATGAQGYLGESIAQHVAYDLRLAYFDKLQQLGFDYHGAHHSGDLIARGMLDLEGLRAYLESGALRLIVLVLLLGLGAWRLLSIDAVLAALALSFVPFVVWRAVRMGILLRITWTKLQQLMSRMTLILEENLQGMRVVRAFAAKATELARFDVISDAGLALSNKRIAIRMSTVSLMNLAQHVSMALVLWVGGQRVAAGTLSVGTLTEVLAFISILQQPLRQIGMIVNSSARAASASGRLFEVLDTQPAIRDMPAARHLSAPRGELRFESVSFAYASSDGRRALTDISFTTGPGRTLGIIGAPGSGKSTLVHLIPRFYDVSSGRISIDGQDIREITLESLRRTVTVIQQDTFLFDTSLRENIAYAQPDADDSDLDAAARSAQIYEQIDRLPLRYATRAGERGNNLSGGQRQRLAIARGLIRRSPIVVFDDSSAALDPQTEVRLQQALAKELRHRTTLIIAHRLSAVAAADEILFLDEGQIVERGTHEQLLRKGGRYAELWSLQHGAESADVAPAQAATR
jgi:ATP-binding cassette, subfamily B, multidrug efflux pump